MELRQLLELLVSTKILRLAVHRASTSAGLSIETLADEKNFYVWTKPNLK